MIIDSSVLVDLDQGRGRDKVKKLSKGRHSISSATYMELSTGKYMNDTPDSQFNKIKENLDIIPVDERIAEKAGEIMAYLIEKGQRIEINDVYIAATAIIYEERVLTSNTEHFERIEGLGVVDWTDI